MSAQKMLFYTCGRCHRQPEVHIEPRTGRSEGFGIPFHFLPAPHPSSPRSARRSTFAGVRRSPCRNCPVRFEEGNAGAVGRTSVPCALWSADEPRDVSCHRHGPVLALCFCVLPALDGCSVEQCLSSRAGPISPGMRGKARLRARVPFFLAKGRELRLCPRSKSLSSIGVEDERACRPFATIFAHTLREWESDLEFVPHVP